MKSGRHQSPPSRTGDCANSNVSTKGNLNFVKAAPPNAGASPAPMLSFERQIIARLGNRLKMCSNTVRYQEVLMHSRSTVAVVQVPVLQTSEREREKRVRRTA